VTGAKVNYEKKETKINNERNKGKKKDKARETRCA
jgi:hypothetical protein